MSFWLLVVACGLLAGATLSAARWLAPPAGRRGLPGAARRAAASAAVVTALQLAVAAAAALLFLLLARAWQGGAPLAVDVLAARLARAAWTPATQQLMEVVTDIGDPLTLAAIGAVVGLGLLWRGERLLLIGWLVALGGNAWLNPALKNLFVRVRPLADIDSLGGAVGYSFPSGHSSGAMVCYGMLVYLGWQLAPARWQLPLGWLAVALITAVGASRILLQVHFFSDVLAGFASGGVWLALTVAACSVVRRRGQNLPC